MEPAPKLNPEEQGHGGSAAGAAAPAKRRKRRWRWYVRAAVLIAVLIPVALAVMTQGPIPAAIIRAYVKNNLGLDFDADWVSLKLDGRLVVSGMTLRMPTVDGEAGEFIKARRVEVDMDMSGLGSLVVKPTHVAVQGPVIRFSQSKKDGALNIAAMQLTSGGTPTRLPRIDITEGTVEFGEHSGAEYRGLMTVAVRGFVTPRDTSGGAYRLRLTQEGGDDLAAAPSGAKPAAEIPASRIVLDGTLDLVSGSGDLALSGMELAKWTPDRIPEQFREVWKGLQMRGQIAQTRFVFSGSRMSVTLALNDVSLRPPIVAGQPDVMGDHRPRMDSVAGTLRFTPEGVEADLAGDFEDQPCRVFVRTDGLAFDAPYSATLTTKDARLDYLPRIVRFMPAVVSTNLERLGWPTGTLAAAIVIRRGAPENGVAAEATIEGTATIDGATIEYNEFMYPFKDAHALLTFDRERVRVVSMTGRSDSGARLLAEGVFEPPDETAKCDLTVTVIDAVIDDQVRSAVERSRGGGIARALFSKERYEQLLTQGLVLTEQTRRRLELRLAQLRSGIPEDRLDPADRGIGIEEINRRLARPVFPFGGDVRSVVIHVTRPQGQDEHTSMNIEADFGRAGLLPEVFPYPIIAEDLHLSMTDNQASVKGERFRGLMGGTASVTGGAKFLPMSDRDGAVKFTLDVDVSAKDIPVDDLVLFAVPDGRLELKVRSVVGPPAPRREERFSVKRTLAALGLEGPVDCRALLTTGEDGATDFDISVELKQMTSLPRHAHGGQAMMATNITGKLRVRDEEISVESLEGLVLPADMGLAGLHALADAGEFRVNGSAKLDSPDGGPLGNLSATMEVTNLDLTLAVEDLLGAVLPDGAGRIAEVRRKHNPSGRLDGSLRLRPGVETGLSVSGIVTGARDISADGLGGRLHAELEKGTAEMPRHIALHTATDSGDIFEDAVIEFMASKGRVWMNDEPPSSFTVTGTVRLPAGGKGLRLVSNVDAIVEDARIESALARGIIGLAAGEQLAAGLKEADLRGQFDATARMRPRSPTSGPEDWKLMMAVAPEWAEATLDGIVVRVPEMSGLVTLDDTAGKVEGLRVNAREWSATINGDWTLSPPPRDGEQRRWSLDARFDLSTQGLPDDLLALVPRGVRTTLREANLQLAGGMWTSDCGLKLTGDDQGRMGVRLEGAIDFHGLSISSGLDLEDCHGTVAVLASQTMGDAAQLTLTLRSDTLRVEGVRVTDAAAVIKTGEKAGRTVIESMDGVCHGGRISGRAMIESVMDGSSGVYETQVDVAGVRFADLLADLKHHAESKRAERQGQSVEAGPLLGLMPGPEPTGDASRGFVDATISIAGQPGKPAERRGRGSLRVSGGDILNVPLIVPLLQLSNLQLPLGEPLDYAQAVFWVSGDRVVFDELGLLSPTLAVVGDGTITLPDYELNLRFNSASRLRLPLLSDVYEALRNELFTTTVAGTLQDPRFGVSQLTGTRRFFGKLFGTSSETPGPMSPDRIRHEPVRQATVPTP